MYRVTLNNEGQKVCSLVQNRQEFLALIDSPANQAACQAALKGDANGKRRQVQICAQCNPAHNNGLLAGSKQYPTGHIMLDVDYDTAAPGWQQKKEEDTQRILASKEHGVLFVQATRKGLHIIMRRIDPGLSQGENLRLAAQKLGVAADMCAKDITRVFFCGDSSTLLYLHDDVFQVEDCPYIPEEEEKTKSANTKPQPAGTAAAPAREHLSAASQPQYKGVSFAWAELEQRYWQQNGGTPKKGNRNAGTLQIAQQLAYFTANAELLAAHIPCYDGFAQAEKMQCIANALGARPAVIPRKMRAVCESILADEANAQTTQLLRTWPAGLKESMAVAPAGMQRVYLPALSAVIGALATRVKVDYNGKQNYLTLLCFCCGEAGSGKGSLTGIVKAWTAIFRAADALNYEKETAWKKEKRKARNKQQQPEEPTLEYRMPTLNSTLPNFILRLQQAGGKHSFAYAPEADVVCSKWRQEMLEFGNISRQAWDGDDYSREAKSEESVSVHLPALKLSWLLCGTPDALHRLINSPTDGVVSRLCLVSTPDNTFTELCTHRQLTAAQEERIAQVSVLLSMMQGIIHPAKVEQRAKEWTEGIRQEAQQQQDRVLARARMRVHENAVRIVTCVLLTKAAETLLKENGFEGAKALLTANPHAWLTPAEKAQTPAILDLVDDVADYLLDQQLRYFRARIEKKYASADYATAAVGRRPAANDAVYSALPAQFSFDEAVKVTTAVKGKAVSRNSVSCMLRRWSTAGKVQQQEGGYAKL